MVVVQQWLNLPVITGKLSSEYAPNTSLKPSPFIYLTVLHALSSKNLTSLQNTSVTMYGTTRRSPWTFYGPHCSSSPKYGWTIYHVWFTLLPSKNPFHSSFHSSLHGSRFARHSLESTEIGARICHKFYSWIMPNNGSSVRSDWICKLVCFIYHPLWESSETVGPIVNWLLSWFCCFQSVIQWYSLSIMSHHC